MPVVWLDCVTVVEAVEKARLDDGNDPALGF